MNINFNDVEKLINIAERANIDSLEVVDGNKRIAIVCQSSNTNSAQSSLKHPREDAIQQYETDSKPASKPSNAAAQDRTSQNDAISSDHSSDNAADSAANTDTANHQITAPMLGTFYRRPDPNADKFVNTGDSVAVGDTLCVIEAMKIMHEVKADSAGIIEEILVNDGDVVEFDQALFTISAS